MKVFTKRNIIIVLFVVFLFLRLFVNNSSVLLGADPLKFMELSKNFPKHTLYNNQPYLLHPPFYPYVIHFFDLFMEDHIAAILISLISSVITFFVLYYFLMMLTKDFNLTFFVLLFFTLSVGFIIASRAPLRESFVIMLMFLTFYFYVGGVKFNDKKSIIIATIFGSISAITSDHVIYLIPALVLSYIIFNKEKINIKKFKFPNLKYIILPLIVIMLFYGSWTFAKYYQYSQYDYYPNGRSGGPLDTRNFGLYQVIDVRTFEGYQIPYYTPGIFSNVKSYAYNFGYMFDIEPFSIPIGLNFTTMKFLLYPNHIFYMFAVYLPLFLILLYGLYHIVKDILRSKKIHNNVNLYTVLLFIIFVSPITNKVTSARHMYISYVFLFYFISYGLIILFEKKLKLHKLISVITILLLFIIPFGIMVTAIWSYLTIK